MKTKVLTKVLQSTLVLLFYSSPNWAETPPVSITLLHTNDLHSHFRPEKTPLALGGVARLRTAIQNIRKETPNTLLIDGGDWSEGSIHYMLSGGFESLQMMDHLGYDVAVVGNHDWLNGPDWLLNILLKGNPSVQFISANLDLRNYIEADRFSAAIKPYIIRNTDGVRIAFIGLSTYEQIYDKFFDPIRLTPLSTLTAQISKELKERGKADVVVAVSHNSVQTNQSLLQEAPYLDLIIGAHDHEKLIQPVIAHRKARPGSSPEGWVVEAGAWGRYLGRVDLSVIPGKKVELIHSELIQMDFTVPEDPETLSMIDRIEEKLEERHGPIFHDHEADSQMDLVHKGEENLMGNLVTDALLQFTHADLAIDSYEFIYGELHPGPIHTADIINVYPAVYNPQTDRTWTVKIIPVSGRALKWFLHSMYAISPYATMGLLSVSGAEIIYNPWFNSSSVNTPFGISRFLQSIPSALFGPSLSGVEEIKIQGVPLNLNATYRMATNTAVVESIHFFNQKVKEVINPLARFIPTPDMIPLDKMEDTRVETWRVIKNYIRSISPITPKNLSFGNRIQSVYSDLGVYQHDVSWEPQFQSKKGMFARIHASIKNYGNRRSSAGTIYEGPRVHLLSNKNGINETVLPEYREIGVNYPIPTLAPGDVVEFEWDSWVPEYSGLFPITVKIEGTNEEIHQKNDEVTVWFEKK